MGERFDEMNFNCKRVHSTLVFLRSFEYKKTERAIKMQSINIKFLSFFLFVIIFSSCSKMDYKDASKKIMSYMNKGQYDLAIAESDKVLAVSPNSKFTYYTYVLKGTAYVYKKEYVLAIETYEKAIKINSNLPNAFSGRIYAYWGMKDYDKTWEDVLKVESLGGTVNAEFLGQLKRASGRSLGITVPPQMMPSFTSLEESRMPVALYINKIASIMDSQRSLLWKKTKNFLVETLWTNTEQRSSQALEARLAMKQVQEEVMALPVPNPCKNYYYLTVEWLQLYVALYNQIENSNLEEAKRIYQKIQVVSKQYTDESKSLVNQYVH